jgi:hypothetical protein
MPDSGLDRVPPSPVSFNASPQSITSTSACNSLPLFLPLPRWVTAVLAGQEIQMISRASLYEDFGGKLVNYFSSGRLLRN